MPSETSSIITVTFLDESYRNVCFCPKQNETRPVQLADPPSRESLRMTLLQLLNEVNPITHSKYKRLASHLSDREADSQWMLSIIQFIHPMHAMFEEGFVSKKVEPANEVRKPVDPKIEAYRGAFDS